MFYCIHLQLLIALQLIYTIICYKINSNDTISLNRLDNYQQVEKVKEIVGRRWVSDQANVKINLHLQILGLCYGYKKSTYVNLLNVMQMLDYGDMISLSRLSKRAIKTLSKEFQPTSYGDFLLYLDDTKVEGQQSKRAPLLFPIDDTNLISKAINTIRNKSKDSLNDNFIVIVDKKIPCGTGLGGGSSDAATCIRLLIDLMELDIDKMEIAKEIGSDVPFLLGNNNNLTTSIGIGKGDLFNYIELKNLPLYVYLFIPNINIETSKVYDRIKKLYPMGSKLSEEQLLNIKDMAIKSIDKFEFRNDLLPTSCHFSKNLVKLTNILESQNIFHWSLTGSGSACFGFPKPDVTDRQISNELNRISLQYEDPLSIIYTKLK